MMGFATIGQAAFTVACFAFAGLALAIIAHSLRRIAEAAEAAVDELERLNSGDEA